MSSAPKSYFYNILHPLPIDVNVIIDFTLISTKKKHDKCLGESSIILLLYYIIGDYIKSYLMG
jgi:hypothetical protein